MSKFFSISGIAVLIGCAFLLLCFLSNPDQNVFLALVLAIIFALLLIAVGDLMDRVDSLESALELHKEQTEHEDKIMQITCPNCGEKYDMDYPKCPNCGNCLSEVKR